LSKILLRYHFKPIVQKLYQVSLDDFSRRDAIESLLQTKFWESFSIFRQNSTEKARVYLSLIVSHLFLMFQMTDINHTYAESFKLIFFNTEEWEKSREKYVPKREFAPSKKGF